MLFYLKDFKKFCSSIICDYCIFVEAEAVLYDDYDDFKSFHSFLNLDDRVNISLCINGSSIQINVEVL